MTKSVLAAGLLAGLLLAGCSQQTTSSENKAANPTVADVKDFNTLLDNYWEENAKLFPLNATANGDNRYNDQLPNDITQAYREQLRQYYQKYLDQLGKFNREKLSDNDKISYDIFKYEMQTSLEGLKQPSWMIPFQQFWGLPLSMGQYGAGESVQPFKTAEDYDNWLGRVRGFSVWADTAISNFRRGMAAGVVLPKPLVEEMIPQMTAQVKTDPTQSDFYGPIRNLGKTQISAADQQRLTAAYREAILKEVIPTYRKLGAFLKDEYLPKARTSTGLSSLPGGTPMYRYFVRYWTTTNKTEDEIYKTGLAEVKRIRGEMERVRQQVGFKGDLNAFFNYMRTDKRFTPYQTDQQVLDAFRGIQARITPNLPKLFGRTPKTPFEIRQTEEFREKSASAEYQPGTPDGSRPGIFYVPILDAKTFRTTSGMESLFLHEAIPGHHYQTSLQQENQDLPKFRRFAWYGAMGEGWALYTESLGKELGLYTDPYQYMGALGDEIHRAIRLVVDVGMHTKGMTREQAIRYMMENEAIDEQGAKAEIERYMAIPGQALSYKIGALKIRELRDKYQQQLGAKFDIRAFHDELLKDGVMPLAVLEQKMDAWAAKQQ